MGQLSRNKFYIFNIIWCNKFELKLGMETYIEIFLGKNEFL